MFLQLLTAIIAARLLEWLVIAIVKTVQERREQRKQDQYLERLAKQERYQEESE